MNKQRLSLLLLSALALAAAMVALRRRQESAEIPPILPVPEPPEPPRIVLPHSALQEEEQTSEEEEQEEQLEEAGEEPPLLERTIGEPLAMPSQPAPAATERSGRRPSDKEQAAAQNERPDGEELLGYCGHCKERRPIADGEEVTTESGRRGLRGSCPVCGARIFRFLPSKE